jgi:PAS domain S-box-containing protein
VPSERADGVPSERADGVPSERADSAPSEQADGVGALAAALARLQSAPAAAQTRPARPPTLPRWFPPIPAVGEIVEVVALDGRVLFASTDGALPKDYPHVAQPAMAFWLRRENAEAKRALDAAIAGEPIGFHATADARSGRPVRWHVTMTPLRTGRGHVDAVLAVSRAQLSRNTDASREADAAVLREAMERLDLALGAGPVIGTWLWDVPANRLTADGRLAQAFGIDPARAAAGLPLARFLAPIHAEDRDWVTAEIVRATRKGGRFGAEYRLLAPDGAIRWVQASGHCEMDAAGQPVRFPGVLVDVHDRVEAARTAEAKTERQAALVALADQLRDAPDALAVAELAARAVGRPLGVTNAGYAEVDLPAGSITIRRDWTDGHATSIRGSYPAASFATALARLQGGVPIVEADLTVAEWLAPADLENYRALGIRALVSLPIRRAGQLAGVLFVGHADRRVWTADDVRFIHDVADRAWAATERLRAEAALGARTAELRLVADAMPLLVSLVDRAFVFQFVNRASVEWFGLPPGAVIGRSAREVLGAEPFALRLRYLEAALAGREARVEWEWPRADGTPRMAEIHYLPRPGASGGYDGVYVFVRDITVREIAGRDFTGRGRAAVGNLDHDRVWQLSSDLMLVADADGVIAAANPAWTAALGRTAAELDRARFLDLIHPDDVAATSHHLAGLAASPGTHHFENRIRARDGSLRRIAWAVTLDGRCFHAVGRDVTADRKREALDRQSEARLRQSEKLAAMDQLTGGLARDFGALLSSITGSLDLLQRRLAQEQNAERAQSLRRHILTARDAAERAAALIQRLQAFSRRQELAPKPTDINQLVAGLEALIRPTIGPAIELTTVLRPGVWPVLCDPAQLETALLNLCINAREAMPVGGRLVLETANLRPRDPALDADMAPGEYVAISVGDSGTGMTADVAGRAVEPLFTTKATGEGTGLGLSTAYGFARRSGGQLRISSEVGCGTRIQLILPRHLNDAAAGSRGACKAVLAANDAAAIGE